MIELKPRCDGCGTGNALDAIFCQECGVGLNIEKDWVDKNLETSHKLYGKPYGKCKHKTVVSNVHCECVRCTECDKRTETCFKHTPKFDYGLHTQRKNLLDHMRNPPEIETPFVVDKSVDFISNQIPDWDFPKPHECNNDCADLEHNPPCICELCKINERTTFPDKEEWNMPLLSETAPTVPWKTGGIIKMPNATHQQMKEFSRAYGGEMEKMRQDPNYVPLMMTNREIEIVPFSPTLGVGDDLRIYHDGTDVSIPKWGNGEDASRTIPPKTSETPYTTRGDFSSLEKNVIKFSILSIIISLGILLFM